MGRFTEVPAPLEARVSDSIVARFRDAVGFGVALGNQFNETLNDEEITERAANAIIAALRPGRLPFALLLIVVTLGLLQWVTVRSHTARILRDYGHFLRDAANDNGRDEHPHTE